MKRKKFLGVALFLATSVSCLFGQVHIGSTTDAHSGSVLDLSNVGGLGLLLPRVALNEVSIWQLDGNSNEGVGMVVYNTNQCILGGDGAGVYVWDGLAWAAVSSSVPSPYAPEMVYIEGGQTTLNSQTVTISNFFIGKYEVTQKQWYDVMGSWPGTIPSSTTYGDGDNFPAYFVSWNDIVGTGGTTGYTINGIDYKTDGFCYKLSQLVGGCKRYRLPTEAEWEYAAKGGPQTNYYTYSGSYTVDDVAWYYENSGYKTSTTPYTHMAGTKAANELGIYDMSGNVFELCSDWYDSTYPTGTNNPAGATSGSYHVIRGGSWYYGASYCTVFHRYYDTPVSRNSNLGFRVVLVP